MAKAGLRKVRYGVEFNPMIFSEIYNIRYLFWEVKARALGWVGARGQELLFDTYLTGRELKYKSTDSYTRDVRGYKKVGHYIGKMAGYVAITSYPINLFEYGRKLRNGTRQPGKNILTGKFRQLMANKLQSMVDHFDKTVVDGLVRDIEKDLAAGKHIPYAPGNR
jgi:hypothetical protein